MLFVTWLISSDESVGLGNIGSYRTKYNRRNSFEFYFSAYQDCISNYICLRSDRSECIPSCLSANCWFVVVEICNKCLITRPDGKLSSHVMGFFSGSEWIPGAVLL